MRCHQSPTPFLHALPPKANCILELRGEMSPSFLKFLSPYIFTEMRTLINTPFLPPQRFDLITAAQSWLLPGELRPGGLGVQHVFGV